MRKAIQYCLLFLVAGLPLAAQQRHRVAVLDFGYGTVRSYVSSIFGTDVDIGKGISDMLIDQLVNDGTLRVIERNQINKIMAEQNFSNSNRADPSTAAKIGSILGVDAVIIGDITQFGGENKNTSVSGIGGKWGSGLGLGKVGVAKSKAIVAITARMIDTTTGEILASSTGKGESSRSGALLEGGGAGNGGFGGGGVNMGSSGFRETIIGEATSKAVQTLAQSLNANAGRLPTVAPPAPVAVVVDGKIADAEALDSVVINVGSSSGVKVGDQLQVSHVVRVVKDPTTGQPLRSVENPVGVLTITSVDAGSAVGVFSGAGKPQVGDSVKSQ
ncbi:MAG: curli production assembly protein CsgG [Acidobacteriaceae bacterium]|nr:curli production assembly protein CsgG [Acidobacteriaceae bacterium]